MKFSILISIALAGCAAADDGGAVSVTLAQRDETSVETARAIDRCAGVADGTNAGCALGETPSGGTNGGIVTCRNGVSEVDVCGPVATCVVGADGTGRCSAYACDPASTPTTCTAGNDFIECNADTNTYSQWGCSGHSRCDPVRGCVEVAGTACDPASFPPFCGDGIGQPSQTVCDPATGTVVVRSCAAGASCTTALGPAQCLTPPPTGATMPWVNLSLCVGNNIGILVPNENPPSTGTWQVAACPDGRTCDWDPATGQAWCRSIRIIDRQIALATEPETHREHCEQ
jgi:hypothetical protein